MLLHRISFSKFLTGASIVIALSACVGTQTKPNVDAEAQRIAETNQRMQSEFAKGINAYTSGNYQQAESIFYAMSRAYPGHAPVHANLTMVYAHQGKVDEAEQEFRTALELDQNQPELYNHMGIMYRKKGEFGQAMLKYKEGLEIAPDHPSLLANMGILYDLYLGKPEEAVKFYQRHRELRPNDKKMQLWHTEIMQRVPSE